MELFYLRTLSSKEKQTIFTVHTENYLKGLVIKIFSEKAQLSLSTKGALE